MANEQQGNNNRQVNITEGVYKEREEHHHHHYAGSTREVQWPVVVGGRPPLRADAYLERGTYIENARRND